MKEILKMLNTFKIVKVSIITLAVIIFLPLITFCILYFFVLTPSKLTPLVTSQINNQITGTFGCETVELTIRKFPYLGVKIDNAFLLSADTTKSDTIMAFKEAIVGVEPLKYLFNDVIHLNSIQINDLRAQAVVDANNKFNFDILIPSDTTSQDDSLATNSLLINLPEIVINNAMIVYDHIPNNTFGSIMGLYLSAKADFSRDTKTLDYWIGWDDAAFMNNDYVLQNKLKIQSKGEVEITNNFSDFNLEGVSVLLDSVPFRIDGTVKKGSEQEFSLDLKSDLQIESLKDILKYLPQGTVEGLGVKELQGKVVCEMKVLGDYSQTSYPVVDMKVNLTDGYMKNVTDYTIDSMIVDMYAHIDYNNNDSSKVIVNRVLLKNKDALIDLHSTVTDLWKDPYIVGKLKTDINVGRLLSGLAQNKDFIAQGIIKGDIELKSHLSSLTNVDVGRVKGTGVMNVDNLKILSPKFNIDALLKRAHLELTTSKKLSAESNMQIMGAQLMVDSLNLAYGGDMKTEVDYLRLSIGASNKVDTSAVMPMGGRISYRKIKVVTADSLIVWSNEGSLIASVSPWKENKKQARLGLTLKADSLFTVYPKEKTYGFLQDSNIEFALTPRERKARTGNRSGRSWTDFTQAEKDSIVAARTKQNVDTTLKLNRETSKMLNKLNFNGSVKSKYIRVSTPYFPLRSTMTSGEITIDPSDISLKDAQIKVGESDLRLTGAIKNYRRTFARGRAIVIKVNADSKYIDCNELMTGFSNGMLYSEQKDKMQTTTLGEKDGLIANLDSMNLIVEAPAKVGENVFMLPRYLDLELVTSINKMKYNDIIFNQVKGTLFVKNGGLSIQNLKSISNIGAAECTMYYFPTNANKADFAIDLTTKKINMDKLIDIIPSVDTIMPMLKSLEGFVDVSFTAKGELDSTMSIVFPSFEATANLTGSDMVLLDGETFSDIAKTLKFKNKKKNIVENIAAELMVKNSKLEVYPFLMEIDRYRVAIAGQHNMDMTYKYHVSVLKSPIPFGIKIGVNITGDENDYKIRIGKAKYKDIYKSAKTGTIATAELNVKELLTAQLRELVTHQTGGKLEDLPTNKVAELRIEGDKEEEARIEAEEKEAEANGKAELQLQSLKEDIENGSSDVGIVASDSIVAVRADTIL